MKKVVIITSSLRPNSNSDLLADSFKDGALSAGHEVEVISLKGKKIDFKRYSIVGIVISLPVVYIGGLISMILVLNISLQAAIVQAVLPFIFGDVVKCLLAAFLGVRLNKALENG